MKLPPRPKQRLNGFTLVELLVVIAIIMLLASLLLPALAGAKDKASDTTCINNFRQMGIAMRLYQDENQTRYPRATIPVRDTATGEVVREIQSRFALGGRVPGGEHAVLTYGRYEDRPLNPYAPNAEVFRCPKDKGVAMQSCNCPNMTGAKWEEVGCSYSYNAGDLTPLVEPATLLPQLEPVTGLAGKPEDWVPDPSRYIVVHEPPARPWGCSGRTAIWVQWHRAQGQSEFTDPRRAPNKFISPVLFADSHVQIHNFTRALTADPYHPYEPTKDWIWYRPQDNAFAAR